LLFTAPVKAPPLVAEELGLHQVARDGPAVHPDEGLVLARAVLVQGSRDELLAGARLAADEHRRGVSATLSRMPYTSIIAGSLEMIL
jgi:hypothetical protein